MERRTHRQADRLCAYLSADKKHVRGRCCERVCMCVSAEESCSFTYACAV